MWGVNAAFGPSVFDTLVHIPIIYQRSLCDTSTTLTQAQVSARTKQQIKTPGDHVLSFQANLTPCQTVLSARNNIILRIPGHVAAMTYKPFCFVVDFLFVLPYRASLFT